MSDPIIRRIVAHFRGGPLCDAGRAAGLGCLRLATVQDPPLSEFWTRGLRWCQEHDPHAGTPGAEERSHARWWNKGGR